MNTEAAAVPKSSVERSSEPAPPPAARPAGRLILALLLPLGALVLQWLFWPYIQPFVWFLFYPAVFLSSWMGGLWGGLAATVLSTALVTFFFIPPQLSFAIANPRSIPSIVVFGGMGVLFSFFHRRWRRAHRLAAEALDEASLANSRLEQRVAERTAELSDLYNNAPCGYHSLDADGLIVRMNDTELNWLGYARGEVVGKKRITDLFTPASVAIFRQNFPVLKAHGGLDDLEVELVRKDGSILPLLVNATAIRNADGSFLMTRSTAIDYTARRQAERQVRESQAQLEAANQELEAFSYSVSHDLRAPLRAVVGFSRIAIEDYGAQLPDEGRRVLGNIACGGKQMGQLIDDLLTFSRLSRLPLIKRSVNVAALVQESLDDLAGVRAGRVVELRIGDLPACEGDPALLKQVWVNLLSNAFKYTARRETAVVEIGSERQGGENVYFVRDNGAGFDMRYAGKLFGVFQRLHRAEDYEGTGVGLAIVQGVVHRHGGRVWVQAEADRGATFSFTLENGKTS